MPDEKYGNPSGYVCAVIPASKRNKKKKIRHIYAMTNSRDQGDIEDFMCEMNCGTTRTFGYWLHYYTEEDLQRERINGVTVTYFRVTYNKKKGRTFHI